MNFDFARTRTPFLLKLHQAVREALEHDRSRKEGDVYYGVEEFRDFLEETKAIEAELLKRQVDFDPISW